MSDLYWWFSRADKTLGYGDGRLAELGKVHRIRGKVVLCERGLHASPRAIDALKYARGSVAWKVRLGKGLVVGDDKAAALSREYVAGGVDVSEGLKLAARQFALRVAHIWSPPQIVLDYLNTGDAALAAVKVALAADAASYAARAAADAACAAADAAYAARAATEHSAQNDILTQILEAAIAKRG